jgi:hypothetical protein
MSAHGAGMADLPLRIVSVVINDRIRLRIYRGDELVGAWPLHRHQALVLAAQLLSQTLVTEGRVASDALPAELST